MDEATSALDNKTEELIMQSINSLDNNLTVIIIAHRLTTIRNCSKIFRFNKGILEETIEDFDFNKM